MSNQPTLPPQIPGAPDQQDIRNARDRLQPRPSAEALKEVSEITAAKNPANGDTATAFGVTRENRIAMNTPERKLEVPEIEGFHLHWFLEDNIPKAINAGYEFVRPEEVPTADRSIGGRTEGSTSEDIGGDRISQVGGRDAAGQPVQLVLMKIRKEWYFDDQRVIAERNKQIVNQIFRRKQAMKSPGESPADYDKRYTKEAVIDMSNGRFRR